jgi:hypothetical protein
LNKKEVVHHPVSLDHGQGDQIGRILAYWAIVDVLRSVFITTRHRSRQKLGINSCINCCQKKDWATFWAVFSHTHLVTLVTADDKGKLPNRASNPRQRGAST